MSSKGSNKVYVVGVGMTKFEKPGRREGWDYPDMARESGTKALAGRRHRLQRSRTGLRRLRLRRIDGGAAGALRTGLDRYSCHQRQQQLLDRVHRALHGGAGDPRRIGRLHHRSGIREDETRIARGNLRRPHQPDGQAHQGDGRDQRVRLSSRALDVRGRRARTHEAVRQHRRALRQDRPQEPQALGEQPVRAIPRGIQPRRHSRGEDDLRPAHQAAVLTDVGRFGRGDPGLGGLRRKPWIGRPGGGDRRSGHDDRLQVHLRRQRQGTHRSRHECASGTTRLRPVRAWPRGLPGDRTARLLLGQRAAALRGSRPVRPG